MGDTLKDTLWIWTPRADGTDTLLLNRGVGLTEFSLPVSYQRPVDTLVCFIADTSHVWTIDTIFLSKTDTPHFESVDCNAHFFHRLTAVSSTHRGIDTVFINQPSVTYDQSQTHLHIHFKDRH
ncbi:MAG: alpha amylase [Prevotella sp.]|nr:alpha amylase [Prevotella sp.]